MSTYRQAIADVRGMHRLLSADGQINDRTIARELRTTSLVLIKKETDKRKLFSSPNLFTPLKCVKMKEAALAECCDYTSPCTIARSVSKLPRIAEGITGLLIQRVSDVEQKNPFKQTTPSRYANIRRLHLAVNDIYYWIYDDYLWITSPDITLARVNALFEEDIPLALLYPKDCDCKDLPSVPCHNPLDEVFRCPGYLEQQVKAVVSKSLLETYFRIPQDTQNNNRDNQTTTP